MISIFHKEATGVDFHSSSYKAAFCFIVNTLTKLQGNIINWDRDFPRVVFKKKPVILGSYIKQDISAGTLIIIAEPVLSLLAVLAKLVLSLIVLIWPLLGLVVLVHLVVVLVFRLIVLICSFVCSFKVLVCPLVVLVYPLVVSVYPLVVLVALSVSLFMTDPFHDKF